MQFWLPEHHRLFGYPVKRDFVSSEIINLYPSGDGTGYLGCIISAAVDCDHCAEKSDKWFKLIYKVINNIILLNNFIFDFSFSF